MLLPQKWERSSLCSVLQNMRDEITRTAMEPMTSTMLLALVYGWDWQRLSIGRESSPVNRNGVVVWQHEGDDCHVCWFAPKKKVSAAVASFKGRKVSSDFSCQAFPGSHSRSDLDFLKVWSRRLSGLAMRIIVVQLLMETEWLPSPGTEWSPTRNRVDAW